MVEGKIIQELKHSSYKIQEIFSIQPEDLLLPRNRDSSYYRTKLKKISFLQTPKDSVAVVELSSPEMLEQQKIQIIFDGMSRPGKIQGTIIRLADWFGIEQVICSKDT